MAHAGRIEYDELAEDYARHRRIHPGVLEQLIERGNVTTSTRVLEVGCGTGNCVTAIHQAFGCRSIGIDPSGAMLAQARERCSSVRRLRGWAEALPVPDASMDLLFSVDVIHHVGDRAAFFREARRVLAPGGRICTATDLEDDIQRRRPLSSHFPETIPHELNRYPSIGTLRAEITDAGFGEIHTSHVELEYGLTDIEPYRDRAYSSLHLISRDAVDRGVARLEAELRYGPVPALSLYTLVWGTA